MKLCLQRGHSNEAKKLLNLCSHPVFLSALAEQLQYTIPQGQYPGDYWSLATSLGDSIISGEVKADADDATLTQVLTDFQTTCESYAQ